MDRFFHDDFKFKVNMGSKKDMDKQKLLKQNEEERLKRLQIKQQNEAATLLQRHLKQMLVSKNLVKQVLTEQKAAQNVIALRQLCQKMPQHAEQILLKGLPKLMTQLVTAISNLQLLTNIGQYGEVLSDLVNMIIELPGQSLKQLGASFELLVLKLGQLAIKILSKHNRLSVQLINSMTNVLNKLSAHSLFPYDHAMLIQKLVQSSYLVVKETMA